MHITPNNKLSNHYRKKKTEKKVWFEDQTVSSSFQQNIETMREKTKTGMFYEDYLTPVFSYSDNVCPDFYSAYPSMLSDGFGNSMINPYSDNDMEGLNNFVWSDNQMGVGNGLFGELTDCQNVDWTVIQNQSSVLDSDSDSLPDGYETFYGLNPSVGAGPDGTGDYDKDGLSNLYEYGYGMSPGYSGLNANSWDSNENMPFLFSIIYLFFIIKLPIEDKQLSIKLTNNY